jgi:hypothetical protein
MNQQQVITMSRISRRPMRIGTHAAGLARRALGLCGFFLCLLALNTQTCSSSVQAHQSAGLTGSRQGQIPVAGAATLGIRVVLKDADGGGPTGTIDVSRRGARGLPLRDVTREGGRVLPADPGLAFFEGELATLGKTFETGLLADIAGPLSAKTGK